MVLDVNLSCMLAFGADCMYIHMLLITSFHPLIAVMGFGVLEFGARGSDLISVC